MSVASLNIYHHGKHHPHPVPKWIARLFFIVIPKLLFMNIQLPYHWKNRRESILKCMVKLYSFHLLIMLVSIDLFYSLGKYTNISSKTFSKEKTYQTIGSTFNSSKYIPT